MTPIRPILRDWAARPGVSSGFARELESLSREGDVELLGESLLQLGRRATQRDQSELGRDVFSWIVSEGESRGLPSSLRARAREELEVLGGGGSFGRRAENFVGHVVQDTFSPATLIGMTAGGLAFSTVRFVALSRLAASPGTYFWIRGLGAKTLASAAAFVPEVTAFWGVENATRRLTNPGSPHSSDGLRGWGSAALSLGLLRLSGAGSSALFRRAHGIEAGAALRGGGFTRLSEATFHQGGMLAGISLAQYLQPQFGLGASHREHFWSDAFATLLHFNISGRLVGGQRFARDLAQRESALSRPEAGSASAASSRPWLWNPTLQPVLVGPSVLESRATDGPPLSGPTVLAAQALRPIRMESNSSLAEQSSSSGVHSRPEAEPSLPPSLEKPLEPLLLGLRQALDDATLGRTFAELRLDPEHWNPFVEFHPEHYNRRVLHREGEGANSFEILLLSWKDGQGANPHDHGGSSGFDRILQGQATEVNYGLRSDGGLVRGPTRVWPEGSVAPVDPHDIHSVFNRQGGGRPLVTLHVYRPAMNSELIRRYAEPEKREE